MGAKPTALAFSASPCLASQRQSLAPSHTKHLLLPVFILPSLPSPCAKAIRQASPRQLSSVGPPHISSRMPQLKPLHLFPAHTLNVYSPRGFSSLLFTVSGMGRTYLMEWSADPPSTERQVLKLYLHIFYISPTVISICVFHNTF